MTFYDELDDFQADAVDFILRQKTVGIFAEQRTGKTWITLGAIDKLKSIDPLILLVVPLTNKLSTWVNLIDSKLPWLQIHMSWDGFKRREKSGAHVLLIHHQELKPHGKKIRKFARWTMVVIDECQVLKDRGSITSRRAAMLRDCGKYRIGLSGTPIDEKPQEAWAQFRFINPAIFGIRWKDFDRSFLRPSGYMGYKREFRKSRLKTFLKKVKPYSLRIKKENVGLKKPKIIDCPIDLVGRQRRIYDKFAESMLVRLDGVKIKSALEMTRRIKLHQITGGFVLDGEGGVHTVGKAKERRLLQILDDVEGAAIVVCRYKHELFHLKEILSHRYGRVEILYGKVKDTKVKKARTDLITDFQTDKIDVLLCQIRTGGIGIDLFNAAFLVLYSITYSHIDMEQVMARINHRNLKRRPKVFRIFATNTIDTDEIYRAQKRKRKSTSRVLKKLTH